MLLIYLLFSTEIMVYLRKVVFISCRPEAQGLVPKPFARQHNWMELSARSSRTLGQAVISSRCVECAFVFASEFVNNCVLRIILKC